MSTTMAPGECELPGSVDETPPPDPALVEEIAARGYWEQVWRRFKRDRVALASIGFLILLVLLGEGLRDAFDPRSRL